MSAVGKGLEPAPTDEISPVSGGHADSLKQTMVGTFTPWKLAKAASQGFPALTGALAKH